MRYYIITGTSRGLGEALVLSLLKPENHVIAIARKQSPHLESASLEAGGKLTQIEAELDKLDQIERVCKEAFKVLENPSGVYLINNAATIKPMALIEDCDPATMQMAYTLNVVAPSALTGAFIKATQDLEVPKRIINVSSGAGKRPFEGWSIYCGTKAAIDLFSQTVAKEQNIKPYPVQVASFGPGVIDTGLQAEIRGTGAEAFPNVAQFHALKEGGYLRQAADVAKVIVDILHHSDFEQGGVLDIKNFD